MSRTIRTVFLIGSVGFLVGANQQQEESKEKKERCSVFVYESKSDEDSWSKVVEEVQKKIKDRKDWFRLAEDPLDADIRIEVTQHGRADDLKENVKRKEGVQGGGTQGGWVVRPGLLDIESSYFIEFLLVVPGQFQGKMMTSGRGRGSAAKEVARRVRTICDTYCK